MEVSPLEGFSELDWWTPQLPYSSNHLCFNEFPDLENLDLDFSLPSLGEHLEEVDQKPSNIVVPEGLRCNHEKVFGDALLATEHVSATCVKKEQVLNNIDQSPLPVLLASNSTTRKKPCALEFEEASFAIQNQNGSATASYLKKEEVQNIIHQRPLPVSSSSKKRTCVLEFDEIKKHFGVPITEAAKRLNVGLTMLKRRCRELSITRWPHRKLKSLQLLIDNVKEMGLEDEVPRLERQKRLLEKLPGLELSEEAKKLRQACFKANYKKRRCMALQA
ncbi:Protein RKD4 [Glycine soja]|nr:hypothetical protein JHK87_015071 [Glycine soja]KHN23357.1 Protein RKD4 [Glycine soja]